MQVTQTFLIQITLLIKTKVYNQIIVILITFQILLLIILLGGIIRLIKIKTVDLIIRMITIKIVV